MLRKAGICPVCANRDSGEDGVCPTCRCVVPVTRDGPGFDRAALVPVLTQPTLDRCLPVG